MIYYHDDHHDFKHAPDIFLFHMALVIAIVWSIVYINSGSTGHYSIYPRKLTWKTIMELWFKYFSFAHGWVLGSKAINFQELSRSYFKIRHSRNQRIHPTCMDSGPRGEICTSCQNGCEQARASILQQSDGHNGWWMMYGSDTKKHQHHNGSETQIHHFYII